MYAKMDRPSMSKQPEDEEESSSSDTSELDEDESSSSTSELDEELEQEVEPKPSTSRQSDESSTFATQAPAIALSTYFSPRQETVATESVIASALSAVDSPSRKRPSPLLAERPPVRPPCSPRKQRRLNFGRGLMGLNDYCLIQIHSYLSIKDRIKMERVCKRWQTIVIRQWTDIKMFNRNPKLWGCDISSKPDEMQASAVAKVLRLCGRQLTYVNLNRLEASQCTIDNIGILCPNVKQLLLGENLLTPKGLESIVCNCINILSIKFTSDINDLRDDHLMNLFCYLPKLRRFKIFESAKFTGEFLEHLPPDFKSIYFHNCDLVSTLFVKRVLKRLKFLECVYINNIGSLDKSNRNHIVRNISPTVWSLEIPFFNVNFDMNIIFNLKALRILNINGSNVEDPYINTLVHYCLNLTHLSIDHCDGITDTGMTALSRLQNLQVLSVDHSAGITDVGFANLLTLTELSCSGNPRIRNQGLIALIDVNPGLRYLNVSNCRHLTGELVRRAAEARANWGTPISINITGTSILVMERYEHVTIVNNQVRITRRQSENVL